MKRTELKRTPMKRKPARHRETTEFSEVTKKKIRIRADFRCEISGCPSHIGEFHHRKMKSAGGTGIVVNAFACCSKHHRQIHDNPDWAYRHGLLVKSHNMPVAVAVFAGCGIDCNEDHAAQ